MKIALASGNAGKLAEFERLLAPLGAEVVSQSELGVDGAVEDGETFVENALFLGKWLLIAYMVESLMLTYVPAEAVAGVLGGDGLRPVFLGALVGGPAYLNGYAAVPLVDALLAQGMAPGAAMSFMLAGGVSCIPAAIAVWALVKPRVFSAYLGIAFVGSLSAGLLWGLLAAA